MIEGVKKGGYSMKKLVTGLWTVTLVATVLTGCGLFAKANGVILYGDQQEITANVKKEKEKVIESTTYDLKIVEQEGKRIMVLTEETAQALLQKKLIRQIIDPAKTKTKAISSLPKMAKGEGILFAKQKPASLDLVEGIQAKYEGNLVIGEGRVYTDMFLIVQKKDWENVAGVDKQMAILQYDVDPSADGLRYEVENRQLIRLGN